VGLLPLPMVLAYILSSPFAAQLLVRLVSSPRLKVVWLHSQSYCHAEIVLDVYHHDVSLGSPWISSKRLTRFECLSMANRLFVHFLFCIL
jgi:hypothetical protein